MNLIFKKYKQSIIFCSKILSCICLIEYYNCCWLKLFCLHGSSGCNTKAQRQVVEIKDADWSILGNILSHSGDVGFDNVVSIEIRHFSIALHPNFMLAIFSQIVKASDIQSKFTSFGKFTHQQACGEQLLLWDIRCHVGNHAIDEVDSVLYQPKH